MTELEKAANDFALKNHSWLKDALPTLAAVESFERGAKWREKNLWYDAQGDDLPEIDRDVIVLCDNGKICCGHRPDKKGFIGKNLTTGNIETYYPETYGKGGWNIPDVKYWLDCDLPNMEERQ